MQCREQILILNHGTRTWSATWRRALRRGGNYPLQDGKVGMKERHKGSQGRRGQIRDRGVLGLEKSSNRESRGVTEKTATSLTIRASSLQGTRTKRKKGKN